MNASQQVAKRFLVVSLLAAGVLAWPGTVQATLLIYEGFDYAGQSDNVALSGGAFNGGTGLSGNWSGSGKYRTTGLTFSDLPSAGGCAETPTAGGNLFAYRQLNANRVGAIWGSFLFQSKTAMAGNIVGNLFVNKGTTMDGNNINVDFGVAPKRWGAGTGDIRLGGNTAQPTTAANAGGTALSQNTTYLVLFKVENLIAWGGAAASQTITSWFLSAAQYDNFKSDGITEAELNAAAQGSGSANVMQRTTLTATQKASFSVNDYLCLMSYQGDYMYDEIRVSDVSGWFAFTPVITSDGGGAAAEETVQAGVTAVTDVEATDPNVPAQTLTYSISGGTHSNLFSIVPETGVLTFIDPAVAGTYVVEVQVANTVPLTDTQVITVTVVAGAVPSSSNDDVTIVEDTATVLTVNDFGNYSNNGGAELAEVKITALPALGSLTTNGIAVNAEDVITVAQLDANLLVYTPVANGNGNDYTTIGFKVGNGTVFSTYYTLTVNVTPVNDAPTTVNSSVTATEDTAKAFAATDFPFTDVANESDSLSKIKVATLPAKGVLKLSGSPIAENAEILSANIPNLTFTPALDENGSPYTTFTFEVADQAGAYSAAATMTINVTAVNDPTVMMAAGNVQANAPAGTVVGTVKARDPDGLAVTYAKVTGRNSDMFAINSGTGVLTLSTAAGGVGEKYYVDVTATGRTTDTLAIEVTVVSQPVVGTIFMFR